MSRRSLVFACLGVLLTVALATRGGGLAVAEHLHGHIAADHIHDHVGDLHPGTEGCTLGFWKNHTEVWAGYLPNNTIGGTFTAWAGTIFAGDTLLQALQYEGGPRIEGAQRILLRQAVAALLNASDPNIDYPLSVGQVLELVNEALGESRAELIDLANELDSFNNLGCPDRVEFHNTWTITH